MHLGTQASGLGNDVAQKLDFVWLELTNRCNLRCVHCYAESSPTTGGKDILDEADYLNVIDQIYRLGCRKLQFIGGEPTLNRSLPRLIKSAYRTGFTLIEVFTNLTHLSDNLLSVFRAFQVALATSFYSCRPEIHDGITGQRGSFQRTLRNMQRVQEAQLSLRVGVIEMDQNRPDLTETWEFLREMGIRHIGSDRVRQIGRAANAVAPDMRELCGSCAENVLTIGPDGLVAPCNMSKQWAVGSVLEQSLEEIVASPALSNVRREIKKNTVDSEHKHVEAPCDPKNCGPYDYCCPSTQQCFPCEPNGCSPCRPKG
ncbi:MAG: radical SAM protein [Nitrospira defluvii]|nr:radical SAM protein [Nitrospira defluvii]